MAWTAPGIPTASSGRDVFRGSGFGAAGARARRTRPVASNDRDRTNGRGGRAEPAPIGACGNVSPPSNVDAPVIAEPSGPRPGHARRRPRHAGKRYVGRPGEGCVPSGFELASVGRRRPADALGS
jgi:hypothetical protein